MEDSPRVHNETLTVEHMGLRPVARLSKQQSHRFRQSTKKEPARGDDSSAEAFKAARLSIEVFW